MTQIKFEKLTLPNGLDIILHQDSSLPLVAVNVWYHVGSKDEEPGKTGFAHLFEHLMFEGSKNHNHEYFEPLQQAGASLNGSTTGDRTNYWETLPSNYLELALWLESDRMGFLLDAVDQHKLDIQREVVKNERRQSYENRPYGVGSLTLQAAVYPWPHPYHWPTIGSHEDLEAATLEDVHAFFRKFYTPSNASLAIVGDIEISQAVDLATKYFSEIPPAPAIPRAGQIDTPLQGSTRLTIHDQVLLPRIEMVWPTVKEFHPDEAPLTMLASILSNGRSSRLYRELVYNQQCAQSVRSDNDSQEIAGDFSIQVTVADGHSVEKVEEVIEFELTKLTTEPPVAEELKRVKNLLEAQYTNQMGRIGGFGGKADLLNFFNVMTGSPERINNELDRFLSVELEDIHRVAGKYLGSKNVKLYTLPEPGRTSNHQTIDRSVQPVPFSPKTFIPQRAETDILSNGLNILVVENHKLPVVALGILFKTGSINDPSTLSGATSFATSMLQEGTTTRTSKEIADQFEFIGSQLSAHSGREQTLLACQTLTRDWTSSLELIADIIQSPSFPDNEFTRLKKERLTSLRRIKDDPTALAEQLVPGLFYGSGSAYGHPIFGTEPSLESISRTNLVNQFKQYFSPKNATMMVVGDISIDKVIEEAEKVFGNWSTNLGLHEIGEPDWTPSQAVPNTIYLLDKPGAAQSVVRAGQTIVGRNDLSYYPYTVLNHAFGGQFTARLNMNLRQDKGYSYGYNSSIGWSKHSSILIAGGSVQTAVTKEAVIETISEFKGIQGERPIKPDEFLAAKSALLRNFPSRFQTPQQILDVICQLVTYDLPVDYFEGYSSKIESVRLEEIHELAESGIRPQNLKILVIGDKNAIAEDLAQIDCSHQEIDFNGRVTGYFGN